MNIPVFLVMTPCGLVYSYHSICEACRFPLFGRRHGIMRKFNVRYQYHKTNTFCQRTRRRKRVRCKCVCFFLGALWAVAPSWSWAKDSSHRRCCSLKCLCVCVCVLVISSKNILYFPHYQKVVQTFRHKQWPLLQKGSFLAAFCVYFLKCVMWSKHWRQQGVR